MKQFIKIFAKKELINPKNVVQFRSEFYLIKPELMQILKQTKHKAVSAGIFLGKKKKFFHPSPFLLEKLAKSTDKIAKVNEKAEWMFICGKNIHSKNITQANKNLKQGDFALILNKYGECIGYAKLIRNLKSKIPLENIFDIGNFLRRERKK